MSYNYRYYNAALAGSLAGACSAYITNTDPSSYVAPVNAAAAFAKKLDAAIPSSPDAECAWPVLFGICQNFWQGRYPISTNPNDYSEEVGAIVALFTQALTVTDISACEDSIIKELHQ